MTVFANENFHYEIGLMSVDGKRKLLFRKNIGSLSVIEKSLDYDHETIELRITADAENYLFEAVPITGEVIHLGTGECGLLSKEVAGDLLGIFLVYMLQEMERKV